MIKQRNTIIGGGPAGLAAAIQLKRYDLDTLLIEKDTLGGLLKNANKLENYLGFPTGISGIELIELIEQQVDDYGLDILFEEVKSIEYDDPSFRITTDTQVIESTILIIASGTKPKTLATLSSLPPVVKRKIFYEVYDLRGISNKKVCIIGAGDAAFDYALNLATRDNQVTIFNRSNNLKCLPLLYRRAETNNNIQYIPNRAIRTVLLQDPGLEIRFDFQDNIDKHLMDYILLAIGREPRVDFLTESVNENISELKMQNKLFLIGDVKNEHCRQVSIAAGDGIKAAMEINKYLG